MAEYIEREEVLKHKTLIPGFVGEYVHADRIREATAADVVPVVRCEKCKHTFGYKKGFVLCKRGWMPNDGFCSYGEKEGR